MKRTREAIHRKVTTKDELYNLITEEQPNICQIVAAVASYFKPTVFDRVDFIQEYIKPLIMVL